MSSRGAQQSLPRAKPRGGISAYGCAEIPRLRLGMTRVYSFRSLVDDALRLAERALDSGRRRETDCRRDTDISLDVVLELAGTGGVRIGRRACQIRLHLDVHRQLVQVLRARDFEQVMRAQLGLLEDQFL